MQGSGQEPGRIASICRFYRPNAPQRKAVRPVPSLSGKAGFSTCNKSSSSFCGFLNMRCLPCPSHGGAENPAA